MQRWDGIKPPINYLLRDYQTWLVAEKINKKMEKKTREIIENPTAIVPLFNGTDTIHWIEKLLQIPIADHRKYAIWQIVIPYLFNIRNLSDTNVIKIIQEWLNKCDETRALDFNVEYSIRQNIKNSKRHRYLPIGINKLASENYELYKIIRDDITNGT